jgi:hypothetical protein
VCGIFAKIGNLIKVLLKKTGNCKEVFEKRSIEFENIYG